MKSSGKIIRSHTKVQNVKRKSRNGIPSWLVARFRMQYIPPPEHIARRVVMWILHNQESTMPLSEFEALCKEKDFTVEEVRAATDPRLDEEARKYLPKTGG